MFVPQLNMVHHLEEMWCIKKRHLPLIHVALLLPLRWSRRSPAFKPKHPSVPLIHTAVKSADVPRGSPEVILAKDPTLGLRTLGFPSVGLLPKSFNYSWSKRVFHAEPQTELLKEVIWRTFHLVSGVLSHFSFRSSDRFGEEKRRNGNFGCQGLLDHIRARQHPNNFLCSFVKSYSLTHFGRLSTLS